MSAGIQLSEAIPPQDTLFQSKKARWLETVFVLIACTYLPYLSSSYIVLHNGAAPQVNTNFRLLGMLAFEIVSLSLMTYVLIRRKQRLSYIGWTPRFSDFIHGAILFFVSLLVAGSVWYLYYTGYRLWFGAAPLLRDLTSLIPAKFSWLFLTFILINSFYEEGITRGFAMTELKGLTGSAWIAVIGSVLLQTGYHAYQGFANVIVVSSVFLLSALYFARSHRLGPVIISHTLMNLSSLILHHK